MTTAQLRTIDVEKVTEPIREPVAADATAHRGGPRSSRRLCAFLAAVGSAWVVAAVIGVTLQAPSTGSTKSTPPARPAEELALAVAGPLVHTSGPVDVSAQLAGYVPGQSSGWHTHPGLHLVTVLSGTLTVYGPDCQPQIFGPGTVYAGGDRLHLARNEADAPLEMVVTYVSGPGQSMAHFRLDGVAPPGCQVA